MNFLQAQHAGLELRAALPKSLKESSGLAVTGINSLWTHNDDSYPILYNFDTLGKVTGTVHLNHPNIGWEDLARDKEGNVYIGAFGNNKNNRNNLKIYKLGTPDSITQKVVNAEVIRYTYQDQKSYPPEKDRLNYDMDAMTIIDDSLYLFSKNRTVPFDGYTKIYKLPLTPGDHTAMLVDSVYLCSDSMLTCWVTSADVTPDQNHLVLLGHDKIWLFALHEKNQFSKSKFVQIELNHFSHKAAICFFNDTEVYITDELEMGILGGKLYSFNLSDWINSGWE
ncbi:hypothetical protein FNH22_08750 [Fulvivirga sp. M361]|uniref:hypothetical protein n=1 Tax=Fulvivirga sp. M361 TaxID=2594266 RepID=UPI00117B128B|nr:hypothetical protein [Fulvivirga sp. M361]TRX60128.1 hypothetical protein FNH22_08750 [Fulvivirga sp. M361]